MNHDELSKELCHTFFAGFSKQGIQKGTLTGESGL